MWNFFLNHPVDDDKQIHCINMSQMMNTLQACISMLMARRDIEGTEVEKYMKLLMSTAYCLHKKFGSNGKNNDPDTDDSQGNIKQRSWKRKRNNTDQVEQLSHHDLLRLLENIESNLTCEFTVKKEQLRKISTTTLKRKLKELIDNVSGDKKCFMVKTF